MPEYLKGIVGFIAAVAVTSLLFLGYQHYRLVNSLHEVVTNQCSVVQQTAIDALEAKLKAEAASVPSVP